MIRPLIDRSSVERRIGALAAEIAVAYGDRAPLLIGILNGASYFMHRLVDALPAGLQERLVYDYVRAQSYSGTERAAAVALQQECVVPLRGQDILVVDGIADTGHTLTRVLTALRRSEPRTLRACALLDKPARRQVPLTLDFCGFTVDDVFVVGYGMDFEQRYRALPYVGVLEREGGASAGSAARTRGLSPGAAA